MLDFHEKLVLLNVSYTFIQRFYVGGLFLSATLHFPCSLISFFSCDVSCWGNYSSFKAVMSRVCTRVHVTAALCSCVVLCTVYW